MKTLYSDIVKNLTENKSVVEITIIEQNGSAPRTAGTKMLVLEDGSILGTIGGGLYEAKAMEEGKKVLEEKSDFTGKILYFDLQSKVKPTDMDMICGGELRLLLDLIIPSKENIEFYQSIVDTEQSKNSVTIATRLYFEDKSKPDVKIDKVLFFENTAPDSINPIIPEQIQAQISSRNEQKKLSNTVINNYEFCFDLIKKPYTLYVFGAGHVSCELAKITEFLDFETIVLDDRQEYCNQYRFPNVKTKVLDSLNKGDISAYLDKINLSELDGIIIVTRGHARDREVLECALDSKAGYIGMIGSKSKKQTTYNSLLEFGYTKEDLTRIYTPIGLTIGAQTPEEIAISICAELIQWRAGILEKPVVKLK